MKMTNTNKVNGELAVRRLSDKAREFYYATDPLNVYEYDGDNGEVLYKVTGCMCEGDGLTFEELNALFAAMQEYVEKQNEKDEIEGL